MKNSPTSFMRKMRIMVYAFFLVKFLLDNQSSQKQGRSFKVYYISLVNFISGKTIAISFSSSFGFHHNVKRTVAVEGA